ncbi:aspartyl protease family protein [Pinisolibacter sp.]|uniref:aspartyl protease family protein n=1 Tax=Pinisolibacter sp. TaxID=2172024 RepID=UPI003FA7BAD8
MPSITSSYGPMGFLIQVVVSLSVPHRDALLRSGRTLPAPVTGTFLIDTGASCTCVDPGLVAPLGLVPTSVANIQTPSTNGGIHACNQYDVMLVLVPRSPAHPPFSIEALPVIETLLRPQGIDGLLGRDVLDKCVLFSSGEDRIFTLSY